MCGLQGAHKGRALASIALGEQMALVTLTVTSNVLLLLRVSRIKLKNTSYGLIPVPRGNVCSRSRGQGA